MGSDIYCPNCGAASNNKLKCDYCGSALARPAGYTSKVDYSAYITDDFIYPGLEEELRKNLMQQRQTGEPVTTNVLENGVPIFSFGSSIYYYKRIGITTELAMDPDSIGERTLKSLDIYPLFTCFPDNVASLNIYVLDFGEDCNGAARFFNIIAEKLAGIDKTAKLTYDTWCDTPLSPLNQIGNIDQMIAIEEKQDRNSLLWSIAITLSIISSVIVGMCSY